MTEKRLIGECMARGKDGCCCYIYDKEVCGDVRGGLPGDFMSIHDKYLNGKDKLGIGETEAD